MRARRGVGIDHVAVKGRAKTTITLRIGDRTKSVLNRWTMLGFGDAPPEFEIHRQLDALAVAIDVAVDAESWVERR